MAESLFLCLQDMEKHGRLLSCIGELRTMLMTPIKPYSPEAPSAEQPASQERKEPGSGGDGGGTPGSGDEEQDDSSSGRSGSPTSSSHAQHSSSDGGSDLEELLARDFPHEDLPSLITRAIGKGEGVSHFSYLWRVYPPKGNTISSQFIH